MHVLENGLCLSCGEGLDEDERGLLTALNEYGSVARAWTPEQAAKHPRGPGGRFLSVADRVTKALDAHFSGKGDVDPFDGFTREHLRKVAKARGVHLDRGESRDSIAKKLLDDVAPKKSPIKARKATTKAPARTPRKPAPNQPPTKEAQLRQWRADAAKPGRASTGKTRRDVYLQQWDESIAKAEQSIADAESKGDTAAVDRYRGDLRYYRESRAGLRANRDDPGLDEPVASGKLAQPVNPDRPLAVYGDMLHIDGHDDDWMHTNLTELERIPANLHGQVAQGMAAWKDSGIWLGEGGVPNLDHASSLRGQPPRGWHPGSTWDDVNGVYRPSGRQMIVGRTANSVHRGATTASHEFGHALDDALGQASGKPDWAQLHERALRDKGVGPYYRQPGEAGRQEFWAESLSTWVAAQQKPAGDDRRATYIIRLGVNAQVADEIDAYFNRVAAKVG